MWRQQPIVDGPFAGYDALFDKKLAGNDRVQLFVDGPFAGYEALFDKKLAGNDRVQLLLAFLSRHAQPIQLPTGHIRRLTEREEKPKHVHPY